MPGKKFLMQINIWFLSLLNKHIQLQSELCISGSVRTAADIPLTAARSNSSFSKINNSGSCGHRPQQIMGGLWPQEIFGWPKKGPARYLLLALRASKSFEELKIMPQLKGYDNT